MATTFPKAHSILTDFPEAELDALIRTIYNQKCILLLGPDAAMEKTNDEGWRPLTEILANELAKDSSENLQEIDTNDLLQSAQYYQWRIKDRGLLEDKVMSFYEERAHLTSPLHQNLAQLPFRLIITSTFDNMMVNALKELKQPELGEEDLIDFYHYKKGKKDYMVREGTIEKPLIYHIYGSIKDQWSLVITENDLVELLVNVASKDAPLPLNIVTELTSPENSLLFLGFGFRYWHLRVLLHLINIGSKRRSSFALEKIRPQTIEEINRTTLFIDNQHLNIKICNAEMTDFVEKLTSRFKNKYGTTTSSRITPPEVLEKPTVFISYVRENQKTVLELVAQLKKRQIEVLIDQDFEEVGDDWEQKILEIISTVNYFIIMLSQDWITKGETPAIMEVRNAFKRKGKQLVGKKFILPVKIDDNLKIEDLNKIHNKLSDLHAIDLRESTDVDELAQVIRRDFQLRKRDYA